jgi:hypothetical protein
MKNEIKLPKPIETYFRAINAHGAAALLSSFESDAWMEHCFTVGGDKITELTCRLVGEEPGA